MKLFKRKKNIPNPSHTPEGKRLYAIGDVHGCKDQLIALMEKIDKDIASRPDKKNYIVFLGDLIDRGPDSAGVVEWVRNFSSNHASCYTLMGNHEDIFLRAYNGDMDALDKWMTYGGHQALESYGLDSYLLNNGELDQIWIEMKKVIPRAHIDFLSECLDSIEFGDYFLVHAGVDPSIPLADQSREAFLWIREPFLSHTKPLEKIIVHGHTIDSEVTQYTHRISVDTGAYDGGPLSAVCFEDDTFRVIESFPEDAGSLKAD